jgi:hypothetical protein
MSGPNTPEFLTDEEANLFAQAQFAGQEPEDVSKDPTEEDGDQPMQTILEEDEDV